jgi:hypothetical protein
MRTEVHYLVAVAGAELRMLVLADGGDECVGVDLESGAFVRASYRPAGDQLLSPFDVVSGEIAPTVQPPDGSRPEAVALTGPPRPTGQLTARRAERYLAPLRHPQRLPLLGFAGQTVPYWTLAGDRPSLSIVELIAAPHVRRRGRGYECRFSFHGARQQLPLTDTATCARLDEVGWPRYSGHDVERLLGSRVRHLVVALSPPYEGYCYKVVSGLLPGP